MAIDFKTFNSIVDFVLNDKKPVLIRGRHGIGKSCVIYQTAKRLGLPVVERRASQMTEGDLLGMPSKDTVDINGHQASKFLPFAWFIQSCTEPVLLFLDEVDRASVEVRQGIFELTDSRKLAGWDLHPDTIICAAVNGGDHGANYSVGEMDPAELDRWTVFDLEPTVEDWLTWAKDNVCTLVWDFINQNREHLEHKGDIEPNKRYPSRRSWKRLNDVLVGAEMMEEPTPAMFSLAQSFVGFEAAVSFNDFAKNYERVVTVEQLLAGERVEALAAFSLNEHCGMIEKFDAVDACNEELSKEQIENLANYFVGLPSEAAMKLWGVISDATCQDNVVNFHQVGGGVVGDYLSEILGA